MNTFARMATVAVVAIVAVVGAVYLFAPRSNIGGPSITPTTAPPSSSASVATPAPTPIDPSTWTPFTSARHGLSFKTPTSWDVTPATVPWPAGDAPSPPSPELDMVQDPVSSVMFVAISQALPKGTTGAAWLDQYETAGAVSNPKACWPAVAAMEAVTVSGQPAWIHGGISGCGFTEAIVFAGGRVYELTGYPAGLFIGGRVFDRALFDAWLSTVSLEPASADDTPGASPAAS